MGQLFSEFYFNFYFVYLFDNIEYYLRQVQEISFMHLLMSGEVEAVVTMYCMKLGIKSEILKFKTILKLSNILKMNYIMSIRCVSRYK